MNTLKRILFGIRLPVTIRGRHFAVPVVAGLLVACCGLAGLSAAIGGGGQKTDPAPAATWTPEAPTATQSPTKMPTATHAPSDTPAATATETPTATHAPSDTPAATATVTPTATHAPTVASQPASATAEPALTATEPQAASAAPATDMPM